MTRRRIAIILLALPFVFYLGFMISCESWPLEKKRFVQAPVLLAAIFVALRKPRDRVALLGCLMLGAFATAGLFPNEIMRSAWRELPAWLGALLWIPQFTHLLILPIFFSIHALIPQPLFRNPATWVFIWLPALVGAGWGVLELGKVIYAGHVFSGTTPAVNVGVGSAVLVYMVGGLAAFWLNAARVVAPRRRIFLFYAAGFTLGWLPGIFFLAAIFFGGITESPWIGFFVSTPYRLTALGLSILVPILWIGALGTGALSANAAVCDG